MSDKTPAIGIDLGTVNSVLAIRRKDKTEIICNQGVRLTPSFVFYDPDNEDVHVGNPDYHKVVENLSNGIYDAKRFIGRSFDDENVQRILNNYMFNIRRSPQNGIDILFRQNGEITFKTPQQISAEILKTFKETASEYLNAEVTEAVITVPAYFNYAQRNATKQAADLAGLKVLMLLNEPTAAALHYITERVESDSTCLVFDLGGGTLDISIVRFYEKNIDILNVEGDSFLGGRNFDENVLEHIIKTRNLTLNKNQKRRLLSQIEVAKKKVSYRPSYTISMQNFIDKDTFEIEITQEEFENINSNLFQKCIHLIECSIQNAGLRKENLDKIILVGGSTKMPRIKKMMNEYFTENEILTDLDPDEAVASGAAIQAAAMKGLKEGRINVTDVTPFSLGVSLYGNQMDILIQKGTPLPAEFIKIFITIDNNQESVTFDVYEGERSRCKFNNRLGSFTVKNLPLKPAGEVKVFVTFSLDKSGLLKVTAVEESGAVKTELEVGVELCNFKSKYQISLLNEVEEDKLFEKFVNSKRNVRRKCVKFICDKSEDEPDVKECNQFIKDIDALEFEEKDKLDELVESFKNKITDEELLRNINLDNIVDEIDLFHQLINQSIMLLNVKK